MDLWWLLPELQFGLDPLVFQGGRTTDGDPIDKTLLPPLHLLDSEVWERSPESRAYVEFLSRDKAWPQLVKNDVLLNSDHMAVSDLGIFVPTLSRKEYVTYEHWTAEHVPGLTALKVWQAILGAEN